MANKKTARRALFSSVLALILCCCMLVGTTFAWFTDEVVSESNIIQSGTLNAGLYYADKNPASDPDEWKDASQGAIFNYDLWEPGYTMVKYVKITNEGNLAFEFRLDIIPNIAATAGEVNLADVIDVYVFEDVTATIDRDTIAAATPVGTLSELMADVDGAAHGFLLPAEGVGSTNVTGADEPRGAIAYGIVLKMRESAGNEYQNLSVGEGFKVRLLATQYTWENDSFDHEYDEGAVYKAETPIANVTTIPEDEIDDVQIPLYSYGNFQNTGNKQIGLEKGFVFKTTEDVTEAEAGKYANWHADFVVSFDKDILTGSAGLAGQYDFWGMDWVGFEAFDVNTADGVDGIPANMACRLLEGKGVYVDYAQLCEQIKTFNCGVFNNSESNAGTTITVELRLYECEAPSESNGNSRNVETGESIVIGTYTYTFE